MALVRLLIMFVSYLFSNRGEKNLRDSEYELPANPTLTFCHVTLAISSHVTKQPSPII